MLSNASVTADGVLTCAACGKSDPPCPAAAVHSKCAHNGSKVCLRFCACAEERTPSNGIADDMQACKDLYDMTLEIVAQKAPDVRKLAMPEPPSST